MQIVSHSYHSYFNSVRHFSIEMNINSWYVNVRKMTLKNRSPRFFAATSSTAIAAAAAAAAADRSYLLLIQINCCLENVDWVIFYTSKINHLMIRINNRHFQSINRLGRHTLSLFNLSPRKTRMIFFSFVSLFCFKCSGYGATDFEEEKKNHARHTQILCFYSFFFVVRRCSSERTSRIN